MKNVFVIFIAMWVSLATVTTPIAQAASATRSHQIEAHVNSAPDSIVRPITTSSEKLPETVAIGASFCWYVIGAIFIFTSFLIQGLTQ